MKGDLDDPIYQKWIEYNSFYRKFGVLVETEDIEGIEDLIREAGRSIGLEDTTPTLASEVRDWVLSTEKPFRATDVINNLQLSTRKDKRNVYTILRRLKDKDIIKPEGHVVDFYRLVSNDIEIIDWKSSTGIGLDIKLPFGLHERVKIFGGNIVLITGRKDSGKTAVCMDIAKDNRDIWDIRYATSEMWESELGDRIRLHDDIDENEWDKVIFHGRSRDFADVIKPGILNIIDFLELKQNATFEIGDRLQEIHEALNGKGVAIVACQLDKGKYIARGGSSSLDKPRLYIALYDGTARIISAKNWIGDVSPRDQVCHFKLYKGAKIEQQGLWHDEGSDPSCEWCKRNMKESKFL